MKIMKKSMIERWKGGILYCIWKVTCFSGFPERMSLSNVLLNDVSVVSILFFFFFCYSPFIGVVVILHASLTFSSLQLFLFLFSLFFSFLFFVLLFFDFYNLKKKRKFPFTIPFFNLLKKDCSFLYFTS